MTYRDPKADPLHELASADAEERWLSQLLASPELAPAPSRPDWKGVQAGLDKVYQRAQLRVPESLARIRGWDMPPQRLATTKTRCADLIGEAAALLHVAGRREEAAEVLATACKLAEGSAAGAELVEAQGDFDAYAALVWARWLHRDGQSKEARQVAKGIPGRRSPAIGKAAGSIARAQIWKGLAVLTVVATLGAIVYDKWNEGGDPDLDDAIEQAAELASHDPEAAMEGYQRALADFPNASDDDRATIVSAFIELAAAEVPSPVTPNDLTAIEKVIFRVETLPAPVRKPQFLAPLSAKMEAWADEMGDADRDAVDAQLDVLAMAKPFAAGANLDRINARKQTLGRASAERLAAEWPIEAIRQYVALGPAKPDVEAAGRLLAKLGDGPSVWIELAPAIKTWSKTVPAQGETAETRDAVMGKLEAAEAAVGDPARQQLLEEPKRDALAAYLEAHPGDQEVAAALADTELGNGDAASAIKILEALGRPGELVSLAQLGLASAYLQADRPADAEQLLEKVLASRFGAYRDASRAFRLRADSIESDLLAQADRGDIPSPWAERFRSASEEETGKIFREWLDKAMNQDLRISELRESYAALADIVTVATRLGTVRLSLAEGAQGEERAQLLAGAERAFLSIARDGRGAPAYHLGLGTVYFRLGRDAEGESEFAELLSMGEPFASLAVASGYRDLGKSSRARDVATQVYESADSPKAKYAAASMRSLVATDLDERETWLRRCDPKDNYVRLSLLELEADRLALAGDDAGADKKYAEVAKGWSETAKTSVSGANNAAVAMRARYSITGNESRLAEAVAMLEQGRRLSPGDPIPLSNLAELQEYRAVLGILKPHFDLKVLRPAQSDAQDLLGYLLRGEHEEATKRVVRSSRQLRRAMESQAEYRALAPKSISAYYGELRWAQRLEDGERLDAIVAKLESASVDLEEMRRAESRFESGELDAQQEEALQSSIARTEGRRKAAQKKNDKATIAATWLLQADDEAAYGRMTGDPEWVERSIKSFEAAQAAWPVLDVRRDIAWGWLQHAAYQVAQDDDALAEVVEAARRNSGTAILIAAFDSPAFGKALRGHASFVRGVEMMAGLDNDDLGHGSALAAKLAGKAELLERALADLRTPLTRSSTAAAKLTDLRGTITRAMEILLPE